jgi:hypothetical protein
MGLLDRPNPPASFDRSELIRAAKRTIARLDGNAWWSWIAVCAAEPILLAIVATAFSKQVLETDPLAALIRWSLLLLIVVAVPAPVVLTWHVLRRMAPNLRFWIWLGAVLAAMVASAVWATNAGQLGRGERDFALAVFKVRSDITVMEFIGLPWGRLLASTAAAAAATLFVPAWVFARAAGFRWYAPLLAAICGACAAAVADQMYYFFDLHRSVLTGMGHAMNGWSWRARIGEMCLLAGTGVVWGAASGFVLALFARKHADSDEHRPLFAVHGAPRPAVMLAVALVAAVVAPTGSYVFDAHRARATSNWVRKVFSSAPSNDVSEGEQLLRYLHAAEVRPGQYPTATFSPDGGSFVTAAADRTLVHVDTATGKTLGSIGHPLVRDEYHSLVWSVGGRFLALRTAGEEVPIANTDYTRRRSRFRIYSLPDYGVVADYTHRDDECFDSLGTYTSMMFERDDKSLWVVCGHYANPRPEDVMAIELEIPSARVLQLRYFGDRAVSARVRGLARSGDGVWSWQHSGGKPEELRVRDLTRDREVMYLSDLQQPRFADNLPAQQGDRLADDQITLRYRGASPDGRSIERRLVFDARSGELVERRDEPRLPPGLNRYELEMSGKLRIETSWQDDSKAGEIDVFDSVSGERRQHILTHAQRPIGASPDGRWLVMYALENAALRIYRLTP